MRAAGGIAAGVRGGGVDRGGSGLGVRRRSVIRMRRRVTHTTQDFGGASSCLSCPSIVAITPLVILCRAVSTIVIRIRLRLIGHIVLCLSRRWLFVLVGGLRDIVRGRCCMICCVLLRRTLLIRVAVRVVVVRGHVGVC